MKNLHKGDFVRILVDFDKYRGRVGVIVNVSKGSKTWYMVEIRGTAAKRLYSENEITKA